MSFQQFSLHPHVLAGVESVGFTTPTPIQIQAIPVAMKDRDVLGLAQTGTGKTAAFALPILHRLATAPPKRGVRCLVIAPTRELAEQIHQTFVDLGKHLRIKSIAIYGGVAKGPQLAGLRRGAQVVVACPGRLLDHVSQKDIDLTGVEVLVLDEADTMCDMGFLPDVRRILDHIPAKRQTLFFSATMPDEIRSLAVKILKDPELVQIGAIAPAKTVSHALYPVPDKLKKDLLLALLKQTPTGRALVFTRTKHRARALALDLAKNSFRVAALQGNMSQNARQQAMDGFRAGKFDIMVATDIAAHGIDVPEISHVINFDFPNTVDTYTHRIGRTGRAEHTGEAFTLAGAEDSSMVRLVEKELGVRIQRRRLSGFDYGDFTPEEQFREERLGLRRAPGPNNGGRSGPSGPVKRSNGSQGRHERSGASDNGRPSEQPPGRLSRANPSNGRRAEQPAGKGPATTPSDGRRAEQPANRGPATTPSDGRRAEQPPGRLSRANPSNSRRTEQPSGRGPATTPSNGRRTERPAGRASGAGPSDGRRSGSVLGRTPKTNSSRGRTGYKKQDGTSSLLSSIRTRKPRGGSPTRRR